MNKDQAGATDRIRIESRSDWSSKQAGWVRLCGCNVVCARLGFGLSYELLLLWINYCRNEQKVHDYLQIIKNEGKQAVDYKTKETKPK